MTQLSMLWRIRSRKSDASGASSRAVRTKLMIVLVALSVSFVSGLAAMQQASLWPVDARYGEKAVAADPAPGPDDFIFVGGFEEVAPPVIVSMPPLFAVSGVSYRYLVHAMDPQGAPLLYSKQVGPEEMQVDALTGLVEWQPDLEGVIDIDIAVRNIFGATTVQSYPLEVLPPGAPLPVIKSVPPSGGQALTLYAYDPVVTNPSGTALTFELEIAPPEMTINAATGSIRWLPEDSGPHFVSFRVQDADGRHAVQSWWLEVVPAGPAYAVGGQVTGLEGGVLVLVDSVSGQRRTVEENGPFQFTIADESAYDIGIETQPLDPPQTCWVDHGSGAVNGADIDDVVVGCMPSIPGAQELIDEALEELESGLPPTSNEEFEESEFGQLQMDTRERKARDRAHALTMAAIDPDPEWFSTALERNLVMAQPGEQVSVSMEKLDLNGESLGPVPLGQLATTVRVQRTDGHFEWIPNEFSDGLVQWSGDGSRLVVHVPPDLDRGRVIVGLRPNLADPGQRALGERWSTALTVEVWPRRAGVIAVNPEQVLFPMAGSEPLSPSLAFTVEELQQALLAAIDGGEALLPLVLESGAAVQTGQLLDYQVEGRPYGGRVVSLDKRGGQTLAMLEPAWLDVYDVPQAEDDYLLTEGVLPEHVVYRVGDPVAGFDADYRTDLVSIDGKPAPVVPDRAWAIEPGTGRARIQRSLGSLFTKACSRADASLTFSPRMSLSPIDVGMDISVGSEGGVVECVWRSNDQALSVDILSRSGPLGWLARAIAGSQFRVRPFGEIRLEVELGGTVIPFHSGFTIGMSAREGVKVQLGLPTSLDLSTDLDNGLPLNLSTQAGIAAGIEVEANAISPDGAIGWLLWLLGLDADQVTIGVTAEAGVRGSVVAEGANAPAVYQHGDESRGAAVMEFFATLEASEVANRLAAMLGGEGALSLDWSTEKEIFRFAGEYWARDVQDDGRGNAYVRDLAAFPSLASFLGASAYGLVAPEDTGSSVFNDPHDGISYDPGECPDSEGKIQAPVVACLAFFCGKTEPIEMCGGDFWLEPVQASAPVGFVATANGQVGITHSNANAEPVEVLLSGSPLEPDRSSVMIAPGQTVQFSASATCPDKGVTFGKIFATIPGETLLEKENIRTCRCKPGAPDCDRTWGSPHMLTSDGLAYDYYAAGDHVLLRVGDDQGAQGLEVQARFLPGMGVSWPQATAIRVGNDIVEIHGVVDEYIGILSHRLDIFINGERPFRAHGWQPIEKMRYVRLPGGGLIFVDRFLRRLSGVWVDPSRITVIWPDDSPFRGHAADVSVMAFNQGDDIGLLPPIIDISLIRPSEHDGQGRGMLGDSDGSPYNDLTRRNGEVVEFVEELDWASLYVRFGADWLVRAGECLFRNGCLHPIFPLGPEYLDPEQRALGEAACIELHGWYRESCIHDVGLIGDPDVAQGLYPDPDMLNQMAGQLVRPGVPFPDYTLAPGPVDATGLAERHTFHVQHLSGEGSYVLVARPPRGYRAVIGDAETPSLIGSGELDDTVHVSCYPDPFWTELGEGWPEDGALQLWALDPLSGGAGELLGEMPIPRQRVNPNCIPVTFSVEVDIDGAADVVVNNPMDVPIRMRLLEADGIEMDPDALEEHEVCAGCSIGVATGITCQSHGSRFGTIEFRDDAGNLHLTRPLICRGITPRLSPLMGGGGWTGAAGAELLMVDPEGALWDLAFQYPNAADATRRNRYPKPLHSEALQGRTILAVDAGATHSVVLLDGGEVWTWGANDRGQLGTGISGSSDVPVQVTAIDAPVTQIAVGRAHTLALDAKGRVWAWGANQFGQVGNNNTYDQGVPVQLDLSVLGGTPVRALAAGGYFSMILDASGRAWSWGLNDRGQLGIGGTTNSLVPVAVQQGAMAVGGIDFLSLGDNHALAVDSEGHLWAWGFSSAGQLGNGATQSASTPVAVNMTLFRGAKAVWAIAGRGFSSLALDEQGRLYGWGGNVNGLLPSATPARIPVQLDTSPLGDAWIQTLAFGGSSTYMVDSQGRVWGWGDGVDGIRVGFGNGAADRITYIGAFDRSAVQGDLVIPESPTRVAAGSGRAHAIATAHIYNRQFTTGTAALFLSDSRQSFMGETPPSGMVADRFTHTSRAISMSDADLCPTLGTHEVGIELRDPDGNLLDERFANVECVQDLQVDVRRTPASMEVHLRNGSASSLAYRVMTVDGYSIDGEDEVASSLCPGCDVALPFDQLCPALGRHTLAHVETIDPTGGVLDRQPVDCGVSDRFIAAAASSSFSTDSDGNSWAWGQAIGQALPSGNQSTPVQVDRSMLAGGVPQMFSASGGHVQVLDASGQLWGWGDNHHGQLGNGNHYTQFTFGPPGFVSFQQTPVITTGALAGHPMRAFASGSDESIGIDREGLVWAWGNNSHSNLGEHTYVDQPWPVPVNMIARGHRLASASHYGLILSEDGRSYWALGDNSQGQFGDGTTRPGQGPEFHMDRAPVRIDWTGFSPLVDIVSGAAFALALDEQGRVWSWGRNVEGELGDGGPTSGRLVPALIDHSPLGGTPVIGIAAGERSAYALDSEGRLWSWGSNWHGQLGLGALLEARIPHQIDLSALEGATLVDIAVSSNHVIALDSLGRYWAWGYNWAGQLGLGHINSVTQPTRIPSLQY